MPASGVKNASGILIQAFSRPILELIRDERSEPMPEIEIGKVSDYFAHPMAAGVELIRPVKSGSKIHILGHTTDLEMPLESMQIDHREITEAKPGDSIGIKVPERVRPGDTVYAVMT
jgi:hypothetical protein